MTHFKKYLVVPYVSSIEKPSEDFIENANKTMSDAITDTTMPDDLKMKIYHQNLNQFLLKYDPNTYGVTPMLAKLAQSVNEFIYKNQRHEEPIESQIKQEIPDSPLFKNNLVTPPSILKKKFNDSYVYNTDNAYDMDNNNYKLGVDFDINTPHTEQNQSNLDITKNIHQESLLNNYEKGAEPHLNTRSKKEATHSQGSYGDYNPANVPLKSTKTTKSPLKNNVGPTKPLKDNKKQNGRGAEWATKKFF
jgi:hypothetical protein